MKTYKVRAHRSHKALLIACILFSAFGASVLFSPNAVGVSASPGRYQQQLGKIFKKYELQTIDSSDFAIKARRSEQISIATSQGSIELTLTPHDLRAPNYRAEETLEDGTVRLLERAPVHTFRGRARGLHEAEARFTIDEDGFNGVMITNDELYFIEPARKYIPSAELSDFVFYKASDVIGDAVGTCGVTLDREIDLTANRVLPQRSSDNGSPSAAFSTNLDTELATEADFEFVTAFGGSTGANNEILSILNQVEGVYANELGISFSVVFQHTWASSNDPYSATNANTLLQDEFLSYWESNFSNVGRDVAHMWTGKDMDGSTIGIAYVGVVCSFPGFSYGVSQRLSSTPGKFILTAHELGHNFDAQHSDQAGHTECANTIMQSFVGSGFSFCQFSRDEITSHTSSNSSCLSGADITIGQGAPNPQLFIDAANRNNFLQFALQPPINAVHRWNCTTCPASNPTLGKGLIQDFNDVTPGGHDALMRADTNTNFVAQIYGGMWDKFVQLGDVNYDISNTRMIGYPTADRNCSDFNGACFTDSQLISPFGTSYHYQLFQGGTLVMHRSGSRNGQTFEVHGAIRARWQTLNGPDGSYGLPIADEYASQGKRRSDFEGGSICLNPTTNQTEDDCITPVTTRTLTVASLNPSSGVSITVSPNDNNNAGSGTTQFTRTYNNNTSVSLTAPATAGGNNFQLWQRNGVNFANTQTVNFALDADYTLTAVYGMMTGNAVYDPVLKAPKCGQPGDMCDSGYLLDGRASIHGGPEPNQPNTINNSCADGINGAYHSDESVDAIKVSTLDGSSLAPGKAVRIDVTFWAYSTSSDYLELYYTADANNPNWIELLSVQPSGTGSQTLTTTYQLPSGGSLQAVRAVLRYLGTASPCGSVVGGFDDHDDLIFSTSPATTRTLTVASSNPASGVSVTVSPSDNGGFGSGTTQFSRTYNNNASVNLTAPATAGGNNFQKWQRDGADWSSGQTTSVTMDANHVMTAVYTETVNTAGLQYYPLAHPVRLLDTRAGTTACHTPGAPLAANAARTQAATGTCDGLVIPAAARAIVGNATVVSPPAAGYITLYPSDAALPTVSNLNYVAGQVVPNAFTVTLSAAGSFNIFTPTQTHFIIDVAGYYAPPGAGGLYYHPLPHPVRLLDTRVGATACNAPGAPLQSDGVRTQTARTTCDGVVLPSDAQAIVGNATVVSPGAGGHIILYPNGATQPVVSNLNYVAGQIVPNAFTVGLGGDGAFNIFAASTTHFIVDVTGYYSANAGPDANGISGLLFYPLASPARLLDTRAGTTACYTPGSPLTGNAVRTQPARVACSGSTVPASALAILGNATVVSPSAGGHIILYPSGAAQPVVSNLNYVAGQTIPNAFNVGLGADGAFNIFTPTTTHFIVDLAGYFAP